MTTKTTDNGTKAQRIVYWITTSIIFIVDGLIPFGFNQPKAVKGLHDLGFMSVSFRYELGIGKIIGGFLLILPFVPKRFKEWAYVGYGISMISAALGNFAIGGDHTKIGGMAVVFFLILLTSYIMFHKTYGKNIYK